MGANRNACHRHTPFNDAASVTSFPFVHRVQDIQDSVDLKVDEDPARRRRWEQRAERQRQAAAYQVSAIVASLGIGALAVVATYWRMTWHLENGEPFPWAELASTLLLAAGGAAGMEMYARWAHKVLWHDMPGGWALHKSHHEPRVGAWEANDIYAVANALPAMALCLWGFLTPGEVGGMCFGAGLGITLFGISYVFIHDGLVHKRFPVGPIADVPYLRRVALAHKLHHTDKFGGLPFGMFLGPQELEAAGAGPELDRLVAQAEEAASARAAARASQPPQE